MSPDLTIEHLGRVPYEEALARQARTLAARRAGSIGDTLLLLEHPPVVTLGRSAHADHLLRSRDELAAEGVEVHEVARGGDVTFHAPGQLVGYPILDLAARGERDVHRYLRDLESVLCDALAKLGVGTQRLPGYTGVFAAPRAGEPPAARRKLASIGVGVRGWVTYHGFALNVDLDLAGFRSIVPCGLHDVEMTSVARELGDATTADLDRRARDAVVHAFRSRWG